MAETKLKSLTVYLSEEDYAQVAEDAADHGVSTSAYVRARLGFKITHQGAPNGNTNRSKTSQEKPGKSKREHRAKAAR